MLVYLNHLYKMIFTIINIRLSLNGLLFKSQNYVYYDLPL